MASPNLQTLASRLGEKTLAARLGITPRTLQTWLRRGPSKRGLEALAAVWKRHQASRKAAETRAAHRAFQESLTPPPDAELPAAKVLPKAPPERSKEAERIRRSRGVSAGLERYETERYVGERQWLTIGQPVQDVAVQALVDSILHNWEMSGRRWNFVNFLFFRYIPFNPVYKGELIRLQGKWVEWWTRTPNRGTHRSISDAIKAIFEGYIKRDNRGQVVEIKGALEAAQTRMIWLESIQVINFDDKDS